MTPVKLQLLSSGKSTQPGRSVYVLVLQSASVYVYIKSFTLPSRSLPCALAGLSDHLSVVVGQCEN